jgi:8-oxo-dGTP pyrophosphatase MutT (NUDIX family)
MSILNYLIEMQYWGSVAGGILPFCKSTRRFLVSLRSDYVMEPNTYGVWGGKVDFEDGETESDIEDVVRREFYEETKYKGSMKLIPSHIYRDKNFKYYNFIGIVDREFNPVLNWETKDYEWMTFEDLYKLEPKHFGLKELLNKAQNQIEKISKLRNWSKYK